MSKAQMSSITGDVAAIADVTINTKGGSVTATLKKSLRESLGELGNRLSAATVEFATGQAVLLVSGTAGKAYTGADVRVRKVGRNRFEIGLDTGDDEEIDEVTAAFLRLKVDQFRKDRLRLSGPSTPERWHAGMSAKIARAKSAAERARARKTR